MHCGGAKKNPLGWKGGAGLMSPVCPALLSPLSAALSVLLLRCSARVNSCAKSRSPARALSNDSGQRASHYHRACSLFKYKKNSCRPLIRARGGDNLQEHYKTWACIYTNSALIYTHAKRKKDLCTEGWGWAAVGARTHTWIKHHSVRGRITCDVGTFSRLNFNLHRARSKAPFGKSKSSQLNYYCKKRVANQQWMKKQYTKKI